ncbi:FG-GAP repeat protein [Engelhardtia mirabilis]|uniref:FG-GAP repeat protein n=1 Tax=Engelhardtia mirabilis TaxID=2528011 RepID=A0A518BRQ2_9BACT|nr:hypothetical protein Pla133_47640 [Planctomycetes bacterium Pla133]QDV03969.1 hypothetical protein Pla86_47620 [Planctomycetes bacterium Pla86]
MWTHFAALPLALLALPSDDPIYATEVAKLLPTTAASGGGFGSALALDGPVALIGDSSASVGSSTNAGRAFIFVEQDGVWIEEAALFASDAASSGAFAYDVALDGEVAVVGAPRVDQGAALNVGAAYVFRRTGGSWVQEAKLVAADGAAGDLFGWSVAVDGATILVGAEEDDHSGFERAGAVYVFEFGGTSWVETAKLTASDSNDLLQFGRTLALDGDTAVVGVPYADTSDGSSVGAVYVFQREAGGWAEDAKLVADDGEPFDELGEAVAIDGDTIAAGAYRDSHAGGGGAGSVYVFARTGSVWSQSAKLVATDAGSNDQFGVAVAVEGDRLAAGARLEDHAGGVDAGSTYLFERDAAGWNEVQKLTASDANGGDQFGYRVALAGERLLVGAYRAVQVTGTGAAYVFDLLDPCPGSVASYGTGCAGTGGFVPTLTLDGCLASGARFTLGVSNAVAPSVAFVVFGGGAGDLPLAGGCTILLDPILPGPWALPMGGAGAGSGEVTLTTSFPVVPGGFDLTLQAAVLDPGAALGFALSQGLALAVGP